MSSALINSEVRAAVEAELRKGERLLWADKPSKFPLSFMAIYITGFSIVWTLMAVSFVGIGAIASIFGTVTAETSTEAAGVGAFGFVFSAFSLVFVCIGVCMFLWGLKTLIGPSREIYALTNQRGIIISPFIKYRVANLSAEVLINSERNGRPDMGSLMFKNQTNAWLGMMMMNSYQIELSSFRNITHPKKIEDLIHQTFFVKPIS